MADGGAGCDGVARPGADGEPDRFTPIVDAYTPALYNLAFKMMGGPSEASDVVQETFFRAYRDLGKFDGGRVFTTGCAASP